MQRQNIASGSPWEDIVGYSRAVRVGNIIEVAGTTASENGIVQGLNDYYTQTKFIFSKIEGVLKSTGSSMNDVVRTRIFVCDISQWEKVAKAHQEYFGKIKPVATMVEVSRLISPELLVEIEVTAISES